MLNHFNRLMIITLATVLCFVGCGDGGGGKKNSMVRRGTGTGAQKINPNEKTPPSIETENDGKIKITEDRKEQEARYTNYTNAINSLEKGTEITSVNLKSGKYELKELISNFKFDGDTFGVLARVSLVNDGATMTSSIADQDIEYIGSQSNVTDRGLGIYVANSMNLEVGNNQVKVSDAKYFSFQAKFNAAEGKIQDATNSGLQDSTDGKVSNAHFLTESTAPIANSNLKMYQISDSEIMMRIIVENEKEARTLYLRYSFTAAEAKPAQEQEEQEQQEQQQQEATDAQKAIGNGTQAANTQSAEGNDPFAGISEDLKKAAALTAAAQN